MIEELFVNTSTALSRWVIFVLALGAGFSVAAIYYAQPLLPLIGQDLTLSLTGMGLVPTLTQAGYALGILFLLPLGDRYDRRTLILLKSISLAVLLLACSFSGQLHSLLLISLLMGMAATMAQDIVPAAAILPPRGNRENGRYGDDRPVAGHFALPHRQWSGGRSVWLARDVSTRCHQYCHYYGGDVENAASLCDQFHAELSVVNALNGQTLATVSCTAPGGAGTGIPFNCLQCLLVNAGGDVIRALSHGQRSRRGFGIAGAAGALAAPLAGHLADRIGGEKVTQLGALLVTLSFALMFLLPALPVEGQWLLIALSAVGFDLGLQSSLVAHQNLVYSTEPQARGRLNALLFTTGVHWHGAGFSSRQRGLRHGKLARGGWSGDAEWCDCADNKTDG